MKTLPPSGYATYAIFLAILLTMERLLSFGIDRTLLRYVPSLTADGDYQGLAALLKRVALEGGDLSWWRWVQLVCSRRSRETRC